MTTGPTSNAPVPTGVATPRTPSLVYESTQDDLRESLRRLLEEQCSTSTLLAFIADPMVGYDAKLWASIAREIGLAGLLIPEEFGGAGASIRDAAVVLEELGRAVAPVPFLASAVLATSVLTTCAQAGSTAAGQALARLADAEIATVVMPATTSPYEPASFSVAATEGTLNGHVRRVLAGDCAEVFIVPTQASDGVQLYLVAKGAVGVSVSPIVDVDQTRPLSDIAFDQVEGTLIADGPDAAAALADVSHLAAAMLASEQVGVSDWALAEAIAYLKIRHQFGRAIGSYQSLRHRAAQVWIDTVQSRAVAIYAAATRAANSSDAAVASAMAKAYCGDAALRAVEECLQMHGGIGFTWEHPVHLRLKRAFATSVMFGRAEDHEMALGALVNLPPPVGH